MSIRCLIFGHKFVTLKLKAGDSYAIRDGSITIRAILQDAILNICKRCERIRIFKIKQ